MLTQTDFSSKNLLHFATVNKDKELIELIVFWDSDTGKIRKQKDAKNKTA